MTSYLRDLNPARYLRDHEEGTVLMHRADFDQLDAYESSVPTAPSAGRIYRRTYAVDGPVVFFVEDAPVDDPRGGQLHHPHRALFVEVSP